MNFQVEVSGSGQPLGATLLARKLGEESTDAYKDFWGDFTENVVEKNILDKCACCRWLYDCNHVDEDVEDCVDFELDDACKLVALD
jgi:hypothetical protein